MVLYVGSDFTCELMWTDNDSYYGMTKALYHKEWSRLDFRERLSKQMFQAEYEF